MTMKEIKYIDRKTNQPVIEKPPGERFLRFLYHHPLGRLPLELLVRRRLLSSIYGRMMSRNRSIKRIQPFVDQYDIDMDEAIKPIDEFNSFNDFFYRELKPDIRDMDEGFVSPADGKIIAFEHIDAVGDFFVKGHQFTLEEFLQDKELAEKYQTGSMFIVRLAPNDYHRFHFPYGGHISEPTRISGRYYSVSPYALFKNFTKVFCGNEREYAILSTKDIGDVLLAPVGATMVGTIIETYEPDSEINKGDEMGYFAFGGSSMVILIEKGKIEIDEDLLRNTRNGMETSIRMGERIGG
ncbi:MAG: phosphatidylserine decarboxylase [Bacteroidetes bacterium]|nr:phosphatidylserine decarboxylase [Bacteroidota bacterium]